MAECRHGLAEQTCGFCSTPPMLDVPATNFLATDGPRIAAKFPGTCPHCGRRYAAGVKIAHVTDVGWVCEDCLA